MSRVDIVRPSKLQNYMQLAEAAANRSHDAETQVGSVLVNNTSGAVIATACNGFVRGAPDQALPNLRPDKYEYILHSEMNLISNCSRHGISTANTMIVCTMSPCKSCTRMLFNSGITTVVAKNLYSDFKEVLHMEDIKVKYVKEEGFYKLMYSINLTHDSAGE